MNFENSKRQLYRFLFFSLTFIGLALGITAQTIKKEVEVVKPYKPAISDAHKINILPTISDSVIIKPDFEYGITSTKVETGYEVTPINAAKMVGLPLTKLYKTYFKLGI